jgi:hypothetical protein
VGEARECLGAPKMPGGDHRNGPRRRCRLLESGESLSGLWIAATLTAGMSANESMESSGVLRGLSQGERALQEDNFPHLDIRFKTFHVTDRGAGEYSVS